MGVNLIFGDITTLKVDAVVNVINNKLEDGGIVNSAIHAAAGPELDDCCNMSGRCPTGGAKLTYGFNLPARFIIHTVAPEWCGGTEHEDKWLAACYQRSLELAVQYQCKSVAIPVFSAASSDFPYEKVLEIAYDTCQYFIAEKNIMMDVLLVIYGGSLRNNNMDEAAATSFNTVAEYVKSHYQLEEDKKKKLQIAQTAKPYYPDDGRIRELTTPDGKTLLVVPKGAKVHYSVTYFQTGPSNIPDKKDFTVEAPFTRKLLHYMDAKGMEAPIVYTNAGYDRKLFSKIQSDTEYHPRKYTVVRFALALQLNRDETDDLLNAAGYALSRSMITDLVVDYCISHDLRSVWEVNNILKSWGLEPI